MLKLRNFNQRKLHCSRMIRLDDAAGTILCEESGETCICVSNIPSEGGFIVNSWVRECPDFKEAGHEEDAKGQLKYWS